MDRRFTQEDTSHKETVIIQAVQTEQINRLYGIVHDIQQDLNGKGGIKELLTLLSQQRTSVQEIDQIVSGDQGLRRRQSRIEDRLESVYCVGKWFVGIFSTLLIGLLTAITLWYFSDQWRVREIALRMEQPPRQQQQQIK